MELIEPTNERREVLATPPRRPWSIRRTSSVQLSWPVGVHGPLHLDGVSRDLLTLGTRSATETLALDRIHAVLDTERRIVSVESSPPLPQGIDLEGQATLKGFRRAIAPVTDNAAYATRPLALLLDDLVGASIISGWIFVKWAGEPMNGNRRKMQDVCIGYAAGSTSFDDMSNLGRSHIVPEIERSDDPDAFHDLGPQIEGTVRRLRRIDLWCEDDRLMIDAVFSDSGVLSKPMVHRSAIHEYRLQASAESHDGEWILATVHADPGALPYTECRSAPLHLKRLIGMPLAELRQSVLHQLRGPLGCTHLNDAMRALAEVDALAQELSRQSVQ